MQPHEPLDDLRAIRQIMERARRASDGFAGWFMVLWGIIWFLGFTGTDVLIRIDRMELISWCWLVLNSLGLVGSLYLAIQMAQRARVKSSPLWHQFLLWWCALVLFDLLLFWLFPVRSGQQIGLLIILTVALAYFQIGLFTHWLLSAMGLFIGALAVGATLLAPQYFNLAMAVLGAGALIGGGLWFLRQEE